MGCSQCPLVSVQTWCVALPCGNSGPGRARGQRRRGAAQQGTAGKEVGLSGSSWSQGGGSRPGSQSRARGSQSAEHHEAPEGTVQFFGARGAGSRQGGHKYRSWAQATCLCPITSTEPSPRGPPSPLEAPFPGSSLAGLGPSAHLHGNKCADWHGRKGDPLPGSSCSPRCHGRGCFRGHRGEDGSSFLLPSARAQQTCGSWPAATAAWWCRDTPRHRHWACGGHFLLQTPREAATPQGGQGRVSSQSCSLVPGGDAHGMTARRDQRQELLLSRPRCSSDFAFSKSNGSRSEQSLPGALGDPAESLPTCPNRQCGLWLPGLTGCGHALPLPFSQ